MLPIDNMLIYGWLNKMLKREHRYAEFLSESYTQKI